MLHRLRRRIRLVPESHHHRLALRLVFSPGRIYQIPRRAQSPRHRPQHAGLQISLPTIHGLVRPRLLRRHHRLQRVRRIHAMGSEEIRHCIHRNPNLFLTSHLLEDFQEDQMGPL